MFCGVSLQHDDWDLEKDSQALHALKVCDLFDVMINEITFTNNLLLALEPIR